MSGIKRTPEDALFSRFVRARAGFRCESCGKHSNSECAHIFGRRHTRLRADEYNAVCLCHSCHRHYTENPVEFTGWLKAQPHIGPDVLDTLMERRNDTGKLTIDERLDNAEHLRDKLREWGDDEADELYRKAVNWLQGNKRKRAKKAAKKKASAKVGSGKYKRKVSGEVVER